MSWLRRASCASVRAELVSHCVVALLGALSVGCVSLRDKDLPAKSPLKQAQGNALEKETDSSVRNLYPVPSSVHVDRMKDLRGSFTPSASSSTASATARDAGAQQPSERSELPIFESLVRSERWSDVISDSEAEWKSCLDQGTGFSRRCRQLGRARAVAFVRLGRPESAWRIQDVLAERGNDSEDAFVFAGLYFDVGAPGLCVQLTATALQWESPETRPALWALRAKCLRITERSAEARSVVRIALTEFPEDKTLLLESAFIAFGENNLTQGCEILEQLYLKKFRQVAVSYNWAQCLIRRRDSEEASKVIAAGRREWPMERAWLILFGELALLNGRFEQARQFGFDYLSGSEVRDPLRAQAERLTREVMGGER